MIHSQKTITQGTGSDFTVTNTSEETVDIYVAILSSFLAVPTKEQCDDMYKLFMLNGTGSELITLQDIFYVDYTGQVIHNLTSIYGEGNEPTLETHETLIPQYTNIVLKAKAFSENLQQEYMQMSLDSVVYEGLSLRDIFENDTDGILLPNGVKTFEISGNDLVQRVKKYTLQASDFVALSNQTLWQRISIKKPIDLINYGLFDNNLGNVYINGFIHVLYVDNATMIGKITSSAYANTFTLGFPLGTYDNLAEAQADLVDTDIYYQLATPIVLHTFTTAPTQTQLDELLDIYLTLTSNNTKTGTALVQDRYYVDYDNAKAYDYNVIEPYLPTALDTPIYEGLSLRDIVENYIDIPIAELNNHSLSEVFESENAVIGFGKNLFDKNAEDVIFNKYIETNGVVLNSGAGNAVSGYIRVIPNTTYKKSGLGLATNFGSAYYDSDYNFILYQSSSTELFTSPSNAYYYRFTFFGSSLDTVQLEQGTVVTTYEPYRSSLNEDLPPFVHWFGLEVLGIDTLTVEQMDYYYEMYQNFKDVYVGDKVISFTTPPNAIATRHLASDLPLS